MERWNRQRGHGQTVMFARGGAVERPRFHEETTKLWIERPDRVREEVEGQFSRYGVSVGDTWWLWNDMQGAVTNNGSPNHHAGLGESFALLLEPAHLLPIFDFTIMGESKQADRRALRVRAMTRSSFARHHHGILPPLPVGCEECEFLVDEEHGILLRLTALFDGEPGMDLQIHEIAINEPISAERFVFTPPPGETIHDARAGQIREEPIEAVADHASFTVYIATGLDGQWRMRAMHLPKRRGQEHEHVHLHYHRDDATHSFGINEQASDAPQLFTAVTKPVAIDHHGETLYVVRPTDAFPLGSVRLIRGETSIEITSDNLPLDRLLAIADSLRPAARGSKE